jgi:hypothetical protein
VTTGRGAERSGVVGRVVEKVDWGSCEAERVRTGSAVVDPFSSIAGEEEGE